MCQYCEIELKHHHKRTVSWNAKHHQKKTVGWNKKHHHMRNARWLAGSSCENYEMESIASSYEDCNLELKELSGENCENEYENCEMEL